VAHEHSHAQHPILSLETLQNLIPELLCGPKNMLDFKLWQYKDAAGCT